MASLDNLPSGSLKVLQITDTHLYASDKGALLGLATLPTFNQVLTQAIAEVGQPDLILATGDIVHDASPEGYQTASKIFSQLGCPVYCIPGNHDIPDIMHEHIASDQVSTPKSIRKGAWLIVMLDSTILDGDGGRFSQEELQILAQYLEENADAHIMICMHHQPVPVGSEWMDTMLIENADEFFAIIDKYSNVRCLLWGHIHQTFDQVRNNVRLLATPSTCIQFIPGQDEFGVDEEAPGYRWLTLMPDGAIDTGVKRLPEVPAEIDYNSFGY